VGTEEIGARGEVGEFEGDGIGIGFGVSLVEGGVETMDEAALEVEEVEGLGNLGKDDVNLVGGGIGGDGHRNGIRRFGRGDADGVVGFLLGGISKATLGSHAVAGDPDEDFVGAFGGIEVVEVLLVGGGEEGVGAVAPTDADTVGMGGGK